MSGDSSVSGTGSGLAIPHRSGLRGCLVRRKAFKGLASYSAAAYDGGSLLPEVPRDVHDEVDAPAVLIHARGDLAVLSELKHGIVRPGLAGPPVQARDDRRNRRAGEDAQ